MLPAAAAASVDLRGITARLERKGVRAFCDSFAELLASIEDRARTRAASAA